MIPNARRVATLWMSFCLLGAVAVGFFGAAFFAEHRDVASLVEQNHERVFIVLSGLLFNPWIAGILMSAILAAVMSTLSCQLLVCSSTLTEDFYRTFIRRNASQRELVWFGRSMVLLVSVVAVWLARDPNSLVLSLVSYAWAGLRRGLRPRHHHVALVAPHDAQRRARGHDHRRRHGPRLEPLRLARPLRNPSGLRLRLIASSS